MTKKRTSKQRGRFSRRKGYSGERNLVLLLQEHGIAIKRTAHANIKGDLTLGCGARIEVKNRENLSDALWQWQDGVQYVALKRNNKDYLVQMSVTKFIELYKQLPQTNTLSDMERQLLSAIRIATTVSGNI